MNTSRRQFLRWTLAGLGLATAGRSLAQGNRVSEYEQKAKYLYLFAWQTTWASEVFSGPNAPFVIGILGDDPWRGNLVQTLLAISKQAGLVKGRKLEVKRCADTQEAAACQLVFISKSEKNRLSKILDELNDAKVFTVVEADKPVETTSVINLYVDENLKFILNEKAAERARLKMGSDLIEAAAKRYRK